jgi:hypothetical protein
MVESSCNVSGLILVNCHKVAVVLVEWNVTNTFHHEVCMVDYNVYKFQMRFTWNQWQIYNIL